MTNFRDVLETLLLADVRFIVIGGLATIAHGSSYVTQDLDICILRSKENLERIVAALAPLHPRLRDFPEELPFFWDSKTLMNGTNFTLTTSLGDLDLLVEITGIGRYEDAIAEAVELEIQGLSCHVLSLSALIRAKKAAGRGKDLLQLPELEALLELKEDLGLEGSETNTLRD